MMTAALPSLDFSKAKAHLSDVMTAVTQQHQPRLVQRHRGKESMVLIDAADLARFLSAYRLEPTVVVDGGEFTAEIERLGVLGFGASLDEAVSDLVAELRAYSQRYFAQPGFYAHTDRRDDWPWLLRFALTDEHQQADLIRADVDAAVERHYRDRQAAQSAAREAAPAAR